MDFEQLVDAYEAALRQVNEHNADFVDERVLEQINPRETPLQRGLRFGRFFLNNAQHRTTVLDVLRKRAHELFEWVWTRFDLHQRNAALQIKNIHWFWNAFVLTAPMHAALFLKISPDLFPVLSEQQQLSWGQVLAIQSVAGSGRSSLFASSFEAYDTILQQAGLGDWRLTTFYIRAPLYLHSSAEFRVLQAAGISYYQQQQQLFPAPHVMASAPAEELPTLAPDVLPADVGLADMQSDGMAMTAMEQLHGIAPFLASDLLVTGDELSQAPQQTAGPATPQAAEQFDIRPELNTEQLYAFELLLAAASAAGVRGSVNIKCSCSTTV
eukprot:TRINITY_DN8515_c0_g1_i1.p1 TRINITY_DN8515_c0_g1~~TRINITY_DN8515_c0_g1_i1.p1  ORF type:complete len:326 (-),score=76.78 TRINITY_DN8515_c0_g1_i1:2-979(-)